MRTVNTTLVVGALIACSAVSLGQVKSAAESGLVGIKLYDSGLRVVQMYGTPDQILPVNFGGSAIGPGGAGGRGPGAGGGAPGAASGPLAPISGYITPNGKFSFEDDTLLRQGLRGGDAGAGGPQASGGATPLAPPGGGGGGGAAGGAGDKVVFTRWVYKRGGSRYGFILDRGNRVVQIEAIGLFNRKVRTKKGAGFGSTFADLIKKYKTPDGYEINGEQIVVRFLTRNKVAFRLSRLGPDKPHVVTGVVVAAGKG